jgi:serralysin
MTAQVNDFNGDGTSDVLLYDLNGNTSLIDWFISNGTYSDWNVANYYYVGYVVGIGDFNNDGTADLLSYLTSGYKTYEIVYLKNGTPTPDGEEELGALPGTVVGSSNFSDGGADFNGDGFSDLLTQDANNAGMLNALLFKNGAHTDIQIGNPTVSGFSVAGTGDFNSDGTTDILLQDASGDLIDWMMQNGHYASWNPVGSLSGSGYSVIGTGNFTGNGTSDLLLQNASGNLIDWTMQNGTFSGWNEIGDPTGWIVAGVGDYNGDGTTDILLQDASGNLIDWIIKNGTFSGWHPIGAAGPSFTAIQPPH